MAIWQYHLNVIPKKSVADKNGAITKVVINSNNEAIAWRESTEVCIDFISKQIDKYVSRSTWNKKDSGIISWKGDTNNKEDNDVLISYDLTTNRISGFQFRTDTRDKQNTTKFLNGILNVCKQNNLIVFNLDDVLIEPHLQLILEDLKTSDAVSFF
jgi:hypothetical protein